MYAVVTLTDSGEVLVAASNWLTSDKKQCYWPPFKSTERCIEAIEKRDDPEKEGKSWEKLNICFHKEYGTFEKAKEGQKEIKEQKERTHLLATGFPGILKRQRIERTQGMLNSQPVRMSADDNDLLQMLRDIKSAVQENSTMLKKLLNENTVAEAPSSTCVSSQHIQANLNLPLRSLADVDRAIKELSTATTRKKYVKYLSGLGGFGPKDVIKNIMQQLLTDDLAKDFNWQGRGDKRPFSQLGIILEVIRDAAFKKKVSSADCEAEIKKYLSYTADRLARKRPREEGGPGLQTDGQD